MRSGLFVTFFDADESRARELPPVGPLDQVVVRQHQLVAERVSVEQADDPRVTTDRWLEAELELQRATGEEPSGPKRQHMRVSARDGVFVRFTVFGEAGEPEPTGELGPFGLVAVGPRTVEADGLVLATRAASELAPWELTAAAGSDAVGLQRPDIAFRTASGTYHASIATTSSSTTGAVVEPTFSPRPMPLPPPPAEPMAAPPPRSKPAFDPSTVAPAPPPSPSSTAEPAALTATDLEGIFHERIERARTEETLRARVQREERRRRGVDEAAAEEEAATTFAMRYRPQAATGEGAGGYVEPGGGRSFGGLLWRLRFAIIGILLVGAGAYGFLAIRNGIAPSAPAYTFVGVGSRFSGTRWDWVVNGVQRVNDAGAVRAQGVFYVVRIAATNKGADGAQLAPNEFTLIDADGVEHSASGLGSGVYRSAENPASPNLWPASFPAGKSTTFSVLFDIDPSLPRGMSLAIADTPGTRVHLD